MNLIHPVQRIILVCEELQTGGVVGFVFQRESRNQFLVRIVAVMDKSGLALYVAAESFPSPLLTGFSVPLCDTKDLILRASYANAYLVLGKSSVFLSVLSFLNLRDAHFVIGLIKPNPSAKHNFVLTVFEDCKKFLQPVFRGRECVLIVQ